MRHIPFFGFRSGFGLESLIKVVHANFLLCEIVQFGFLIFGL